MTELFDNLGIDMEASDMSFSVSLNKNQGCEWVSRNGLRSLFAQKSDAVNANLCTMLKEIEKFKDDVTMYFKELENNPDMDRSETLGHFIKSRGYSELFEKAYLVPMCASMWSSPSDQVMDFSAFSVLSLCRNHHLLQLSGCPQGLTVKGRSHHYVHKLREELEVRGTQIRTSCAVHSVSTSDMGCMLFYDDGSEVYDGCIMAVPAPTAIKILGKEATRDEMRVLGAFQYFYCDIFLHHDKNLMPQNPEAWSALNFMGSTDSKVWLTYWLNLLQNIGETGQPFLMTVNPPHQPEDVLFKWSTYHAIPSVEAAKASLELSNIQGKRGIWFCGAYDGFGFHEDGLKAGMNAAHSMLGRSFAVLSNLKQMVPSWTESAACLFMTKFLECFLSAGCSFNIHSPSFNEKFIKTLEYYLEHYAVGLNMPALGDYQILLSQPGDVAESSVA